MKAPLSKDEVIGRRVMPTAEGFLPPLEAGDYGRAPDHPHAKWEPRMAWWEVVAPTGETCLLNPAVHTVTEHEDGTITVIPSIVMPAGQKWHGFLTRGIGRRV